MAGRNGFEDDDVNPFAVSARSTPRSSSRRRERSCSRCLPRLRRSRVSFFFFLVWFASAVFVFGTGIAWI